MRWVQDDNGRINGENDFLKNELQHTKVDTSGLIEQLEVKQDEIGRCQELFQKTI